MLSFTVAVTIWDALSAITPILAVLLSSVLTAMGFLWWNHERRIRGLEKTSTRHGRTLYGDEDDVQQTGLAQDISNLVENGEQVLERIRSIEKKLDED